MILFNNSYAKDCAPPICNKDRRLEGCSIPTLFDMLEVKVCDPSSPIREYWERQRQILRQLTQTIYFIRRNCEHFSFHLLVLAVVF